MYCWKDSDYIGVPKLMISVEAEPYIAILFQCYLYENSLETTDNEVFEQLLILLEEVLGNVGI